MVRDDLQLARVDLEYAKEQARAYFNARIAALRLSDVQRKKVRRISKYLKKHLIDAEEGDEMVSFLSELAADVNTGLDLGEAIYFLTNVEVFLPDKGHPSNEALRSAVFWLLLNYADSNSSEMGIGVGVDSGGTQKYDSALVAWLDKNLWEIGITNSGRRYVRSAIATAARDVTTSTQWTSLSDPST